MCAHRRSSGAKGNHLVETAGVWESAAIRQTSLAPADYLKARSPPLVASAADNLIPQKRRKNYKVGGKKRKRREREEDFFPRHPTLSGERRPTLPFPRNLLDALPRSIVASLSLAPLFVSILPLLLSHGTHPSLSLSLAPTSSSILFTCLQVFVRKGTDRGQASFEFRSRVTAGVDLKICSPLARRRPEVVQLESCTV